MLESHDLFQSPLNSTKDYTVEIPNLDETQPLFVGLSILAKYFKGPYFKALIFRLYDLYINNPHKNGRIIMVLGGGDLHKHNLMAQTGVENENDETLQITLAREEEKYVAANLMADPEVREKIHALKAKGKFEFYHWNEAKAVFATPLKESSVELGRQLADDSDYRRMATKSAHISLETKREQAAFANMISLNEKFVLNQCLQYVHEEGKVFAAWGIGREEDKIPGQEYIPQMAYPVSFGNESDKPNIPFFATITAALKSLRGDKSTINLLDIKFTSTDKLALTHRSGRKGSLDAKLDDKQQEKRVISDFKQKIRRLQEETQQHIYQIKQLIHLFQKYHADKELPPEFSFLLSKRKSHPQGMDELDIIALKEAHQEIQRKIIDQQLPEIMLQKKWLEAEVERLEKQVQELSSYNCRLDDEKIEAYEKELNTSKKIIMEYLTRHLRGNIDKNAPLTDLIAVLINTLQMKEAELNTLRRMIKASEEGMRGYIRNIETLEANVKTLEMESTAVKIEQTQIKETSDILLARKGTLEKKAVTQELKEKELAKKAAALKKKEWELLTREAALEIQIKEMEKQRFKEDSRKLGQKLAQTFFGKHNKIDPPMRSNTASPDFLSNGEGYSEEPMLKAPQPYKPFSAKVFNFLTHRRPRSNTAYETAPAKTPDINFPEDRRPYKNRQFSAPDVPIITKLSY